MMHTDNREILFATVKMSIMPLHSRYMHLFFSDTALCGVLVRPRVLGFLIWLTTHINFIFFYV
jgi:hypothetical protein